MERRQYTIRDIPSPLDHALREMAHRSHKSLNETVKDILTKGAGMTKELHRHDDLDAFFGSWVEDRQVDKALASQRHIDKKLWK
ncbi:MAG: hypothetical protein AABZ44_04380 [Elusimicrobiota bacterium]